MFLHLWKDWAKLVGIESAKEALFELIGMSNNASKKIIKYKNALFCAISLHKINMNSLNMAKRRLQFYIDIVQRWFNQHTKKMYDLTN